MGKRKYFSLSVGGNVRFKGNWILQNTDGSVFVTNKVINTLKVPNKTPYVEQ